VNSLRESCIIVFTAIVQSFNTDPEQRRVIEVYFPMIEQLVKSIAASQPPATDSLLASTLGLVGDLVVTFGANIVSFAESEHVGSIISRLRRSKQSKARTSIRYITQEISVSFFTISPIPNFNFFSAFVAKSALLRWI
jgi:hypothetical protein